MLVQYENKVRTRFDWLFNCLNTKYHLQNLFTFQALLEALSRLPMVTIHPVTPDDFCNYNRLMCEIFWALSGQVKRNHIFSCNDGRDKMTLRESNLEEHKEISFTLWKKKGI